MKKLKDIKRPEEMFKVPENYFDQFQERMSELTSEQSPARSVPRPAFRLAYTIPALLLVILTGYFVFDREGNGEGLADISTDDLVAFLEEDGITEVELIGYLDEIDVNVEELESGDYPDYDLLKDIGEEDLQDLSNELEDFL